MRGTSVLSAGGTRRRYAVTGGALVVAFALSASVAIAQRGPRQIKETDPPVVVPRGPLPPKPEASAARPLDSPEPPWPTGIIEDDESPFYREADVKNRWVEEVGKDRYRVVYAGALQSDPTQGVLIVTEAGPTHAAKVGQGVYLVPGRTGAVRISGANAGQLTLTPVEGPKTVSSPSLPSAVFDLNKGAFL